MNAPRVLVARMDNCGDVLLGGPAVRAVAASARVTFLCGPTGEAAARILPGVDDVLVQRAEWIEADPRPIDGAAMADFVDGIAAYGFDEALILTSFHQSALPLALLLRMAGVPTIAAISTDYPGSLLDVRHAVDDAAHEVERNLSLVATLGYRLPAGDDGELRVEIGDVAPPPETPGEPFVVLHPGASVSARAWAPSRMSQLAALLAARGRRVVVTGARAERALTARVASAAADGDLVIDLGGRTTLASLAAVLARASAIVTGNTGPAHLAGAVGTPVVSLYAPTVPASRWRPWRVPHVLLGDQDIACAGCRARECPIAGHPCIDAVNPRDVVDAVEALAPSFPVAEELSA